MIVSMIYYLRATKKELGTLINKYSIILLSFYTTNLTLLLVTVDTKNNFFRYTIYDNFFVRSKVLDNQVNPLTSSRHNLFACRIVFTALSKRMHRTKYCQIFSSITKSIPFYC